MKTFIARALALLLLALTSQAAPLSGTKSVGPTGNYASITAAIADVQAVGNGLGGALVLELQATYVGTVETFPLTIPAFNGASAVNTLTVRPQTGAVGLVISSADTTAATVDLNGAQFVTIDGRPGGVGNNAGSGGGTASQLTIANTSTSGRALRFINEASNNSITYTTLRGVNTSATSGTVVFSTTTGANGNDNNTLDHCDIRDGASTPANGLYALGSTGIPAKSNSSNTVANCNVFNFYAAIAVESAGVRLDGFNGAWTISGNSFYQTASRAAVGANVRAIYINETSGNNFMVTDNFIGGDSPGAAVTTQTWTTTGTTAAYVFQGIRLNVDVRLPSSVQGNTIRNFAWTSSSNASTLPGVWSGIYVQAGNMNIGTVTGNTIGSGTGTGSISFTTSGTRGTAFGISSSSSGTLAISNNTVGSITTNGTDTTVSASLTGIQVTAGANTISNNLVGSAATANSLNAATSATPNIINAQQVTGILSSSSGSAVITGNALANLNNNYVGIGSSSGQIRGVVTSAGANTITGNTVRNLSTTSLNNLPATTGAVLGIAQSSTVAGQTVSRNVVHSLSDTAPTGSVSVIGIYYAGNTTTGPNVIAQNLVHSLAITSTTLSALEGMQFGAGTFTAQNNMVRVGLDANGVSTGGGANLRGIYDNGTDAGRNFYNNSVYSGGTQTAGANITIAFQSTGATNARDFRNNIFVSTRTRGGTATSSYGAVMYGGTTANPAGLTSNNNIFFTSGTGSFLGIYNGASISTLSAWRTATGQDAASLSTDPLFIAPNGTAATVDLHIPTNSPANNAGLALAVVTNDFDGDARSATTPAIGADEAIVANIAVSQGGALTDGVSSVGFGTVTLGSSSAAKTFTITNPGGATLNSLAITKDGANAGEFTVSALSGTTVPVGSGSVTFAVSFAPGASGARSAAIHIASNVAGAKNPFDITLAGTGQTVFAAWAAANGVANDINALGSNGLANLLNFAFGVNPVTGGNGALVFNGTFGAGGTIGANGQPTLMTEPTAFGVDFRALFVRRKDAAAAGLTYSVEFSNASLGAWVASAAVPTVLADDGTHEVVSVPYPPFVAGKKARFFRIKATQTP